ncbi:hypothetical protein CBER1_09418 [Cercospora berteroae]|uniref:Uncharacterized protein n=1 Tax=Cercospora berteroae TaxID=357750 RepID=A0A2S6CE02_9PEZI|nr:hypothetical protein CBER1_09418 [Cercospora berteroae]
MLRTLLLAAAAGVSAANIPSADIVERSNNPPSYLCSSSNKKCSQAKQLASVTAFCSSYLNVPKTATKTVTRCTTSTKTNTQVTGTVTKPASIVTTTVTGCVRPAITPASGGEPVGNSSPAAPSKRDAEQHAEKRHGSGLQKPSCLSDFKKPAEISAACGCLSLKPKPTKTVTTTRTETATRNVRKATTVTGPAVTSTVYAPPKSQPTFVIARDNGEAVYAPDSGQRRKRGTVFVRPPIELQGPPEFRDESYRPIDRSVLFKFQEPSDSLSGTLYALDLRNNGGGPGANLLPGIKAQPDSAESSQQDFRVEFTFPESPTLTPITCSISHSTVDGTCPLDCQALTTGDTNQELEGSDNWFIGPPAAVSSATYDLFAVTLGVGLEEIEEEQQQQEDPGPEVERGQSRGGNKKIKRNDWLEGIPTGHGGNPVVDN